MYTDEYDIYQHLPDWGFNHQTVCYSRDEYRSLLRYWVRPHRGIS